MTNGIGHNSHQSPKEKGTERSGNQDPVNREPKCAAKQSEPQHDSSADRQAESQQQE